MRYFNKFTNFQSRENRALPSNNRPSVSGTSKFKGYRFFPVISMSLVTTG